MQKFKLSICIPTYNRCNYLKYSLESIVVQEPFLNGEVEIVISDNASTDNTKEVAQEFVQKYKNILYFKNEQNIRDRNYALALSRGHGILRKLSNDTLVYRDGALDKIIAIIEKYKDTRPNIFLGNAALKIRTGLYSFIDGIRGIGLWMTSIACFCIWEDYCIDIKNQTKGCDLLLWQVHYFIEMSSQTKMIFINNDNLFSSQFVENKNISYGLFKVFYYNYLSIINDFVQKGYLSSKDYAYLEKDVLLNFFIKWTINWEMHQKQFIFSDQEDLKKILFQISAKKRYNKILKTKYFLLKFKYSIKNIRKRQK